jgi:hypothetical protein
MRTCLQSQAKLEGLLQCEQLTFNNPAILEFGDSASAVRCTVVLTRHTGKLFLEMMPMMDKEEGLWMSHSRVRSSIHKLQLSISYDSLLEIAIQEVCICVSE